MSETPSWLSSLAWSLGGLSGAYALVLLLFWSLQTSLLFPAPRISVEALDRLAEQRGAEVVRIETERGEALYGWRMGEAERLVIYFSGNGSSVGLELDRYDFFLRAGWSVLHVNYRGYPGSSGQPSEEALRADALPIWRAARARHPSGSILLYGKSLGGFSAISLAAELQARGEEVPVGLLLESSFSSAEEVASELYPWLPIRWLMRSPMRSAARGSDLTVPTLLLHGLEDSLIHPDHARRLHTQLPDSQLELLPGQEHNDFLLAHPQGERRWRGWLRGLED